MDKMMLKKKYMMYAPKKKGRLPSGYQEVEYIQSTGTQYIDTGVKATNTTRFKIDVEITAYDTYIFGAWNDWQVSMFTIYSANASSSAIGYGANWVGSITGLTTGNKITLSIDNGGIKYNNEIKGTYSDTFTSTNNIILCGTNAAGTPSALSKIKIYSLEIDGHNFIPCYRKSDNEIGLYDIIGQQFYTNSGSGSFLKGKDIVNMDGYRQVEYIQGTGSSYIDLGIKSRNGLTIIADEQNPTDLSNEVMVSGGDDWDVNFLQMGLGSWTNYNSQIYKTSWLGLKTRVIDKVDDSGIYINGELKQSWTPTTWNSTYNLFAFASNRGGSIQYINQQEKLFKLEILENGVHIRDLYPVEQISTGKVGLYDVVSKRFFPSETSTNFIKGDYI